MSRQSVVVCDGCGDYGPDVKTESIVFNTSRRYDGCPSCVARVETAASRFMISGSSTSENPEALEPETPHVSLLRPARLTPFDPPVTPR